MEKVSSKGDPVLLRTNVLYENEKNLARNEENRVPVLQTNVNNEIIGMNYDNNQSSVKWIHDASSVGAKEDLAISVQNLCKSYEEGRPVLSNLSMSVRKGTIYGLLGSSGCGKTTLLSSIVGLRNWDSGDIFVFGSRPGTKGTGMLGRRLGFMPQEIALYDQLSIKEMIEYYGRLYNMADKDVADQLLFIVDFLKLPSKFRLIKDLSGGEQRRVSISLTLLHSPELLILDEPTVGLDAVLRESIWEYLYKIVETRKTTVIVTTHYLNECRGATTIGVMRKGRLLVEDSPTALLRQYECDLLETVILKLCRKDENISGGSDTGSNNNVSIPTHRKRNSKKYSRELMELPQDVESSKSKNSYNVYEKFQENLQLSSRRRSSIKIDENNDNATENQSFSNVLQRIKGLAIIMWLMLLRRTSFTIMTLFLPTIQLLLTLAVLGTDPKNLRIGIVNEEVPNYAEICLPNYGYKAESSNSTGISPTLGTSSCNFKLLSCNLITEISRTGVIDAVPIQSAELAKAQVLEGNLWGYFTFPSNYSQHMANLVVEQKFAGNETLEGSRVRLRMDMSSYLGAAIALRTTFEAYENFAKNLAISCGLNEKEFQLPIMYREPVYGTNEASYHDYVTPIVILTVIFEVPMLITTILFISDKKQGTLDRARIAGLKFKEGLIGYILTQGSVAVGQTFICYVVMKVIYDFHVLGSLFAFFFILILGGICGLSMGLLMGIVFKDEIGALMMGMLIGPTIILWEGAIWPIESLPWIPWRAIAMSSPTTMVCASLRSVISRGWGLLHPQVWPGIAVLGGYTVFFWVISIWLYIRKYK